MNQNVSWGSIYTRDDFFFLFAKVNQKKKMGRGRDCVNYVVWVFILYQFI